MSMEPERSRSEYLDDRALLHRLGYAQELFRAMGGFSNFAISFTIISVLAGTLTSYFIAFNNGGPIAITWGWLLVGLFSTVIALAMGEIASAFPTAGGLYYWASRLGSPGWGWFTGWFNLVGQIAVTAAIDYGAAIFVTALLDLPEHVQRALQRDAEPDLSRLAHARRARDRRRADRGAGPASVGRFRLQRDDQQLWVLRE
jgi:amino acid transporter